MRDQPFLAAPLHTFRRLPAHFIEVIDAISRSWPACPLPMVEADKQFPLSINAHREVISTFTTAVVVEDHECIAGNQDISQPVVKRSERWGARPGSVSNVDTDGNNSL
jgi:hypothetical protein